MIIKTGGSMRVLDFDLENRPLSYRGYDKTTSEVTAIAACFVSEPDSMRVWALGMDPMLQMLEEFRMMYEDADMVSGHYIVGHDLPELQMQMAEYGLNLLGPKLVEDTYTQLVKTKDMPKSQKDLAEMLGIEQPKVGMSQAQWREANRLMPKGVMMARERVEGDVLQHMQLRVALRRAGLLRTPRMWRP